VDYPNRALDRWAYENLTNTYQVKYSLFEAYETLKLKRGERDLADRCATPPISPLYHSLQHSNSRTHKLLSELKENGLKGKPIDFVWVDFTLLYSRSGT